MLIAMHVYVHSFLMFATYRDVRLIRANRPRSTPGGRRVAKMLWQKCTKRKIATLFRMAECSLATSPLYIAGAGVLSPPPILALAMALSPAGQDPGGRQYSLEPAGRLLCHLRRARQQLCARLEPARRARRRRRQRGLGL